MRLVALGAAGVVAGAVAGLAMPALAEWTERGSTTITATSTGLEAPFASVTVADGIPTVVVGAPGSGAPPAWYEVRRNGDVVCSSESSTGDAVLPADCADGDAPQASSLTYTVTAGRGSWAASTEVEAVTPPPAPVLAWKSGTDDGLSNDDITSNSTPVVLLTAPGAANAYTVTVLIDGFPLTDVPVEPGGLIDHEITLSGGLASGRHTITATAAYRGVPSGEAALTIDVASPTGVAAVALADANPTSTGRDDNPGNLFGGDTMTVTFERPVAPDSICAGWDPSSIATLPVSVTVTRFPAPKSDRRSVLTLAPVGDACGPDGIVRLGSLTIRKAGNGDNPQEVTFASSTLALTEDGRSVILTVNPTQPGLRYLLPATYDSTFEPAAGILDDLGFEVSVDPVGTSTVF